MSVIKLPPGVCGKIMSVLSIVIVLSFIVPVVFNEVKVAEYLGISRGLFFLMIAFSYSVWALLAYRCVIFIGSRKLVLLLYRDNGADIPLASRVIPWVSGVAHLLLYCLGLISIVAYLI